MKTNQLDKTIAKKLKNRTLEPSVSAWERLEIQLNEKEKKKKTWFVYVGYAASLLVFVSIMTHFFSDFKKPILPKKQVVVQPIDTSLYETKSIKILDDISITNAVIKDSKKTESKEANAFNKKGVKKFKKRRAKNNKLIMTASVDTVGQDKIEENRIVKTTKKDTTILKQRPNSRIKVNSDDLLYAVTHTKEEVKNYYTKYNVNRNDVLKSIREQLQKSNLTIDPNIILAEVEKGIEEEDFENNFMKSLREKITNIATSIASRND